MTGKRSVVWLALVAAWAAPPEIERARAWREANEHRVLGEFVEFLKLPNLAADPGGLRRNAEWIRKALEKRAVNARLLEVAGAAPAVYGELPVPGAAQTVLVYAHYDGQPADAREWRGHAPFEPVLRDRPLELDGRVISFPSPGERIDPEWRIYARSASDDKGAIQAMLGALDALRAAGRRPAMNLRFLFEGEEEAGSQNLGKILAEHREAVRADFWLICDGPVHQTRRQQIYFGARGVTTLELTVYGPRREVHSGHYGNWVPNPALRLAQLLASMKDASGRILVQGYGDGMVPLTDTERRALREEPETGQALKRELLLAETEAAPRRLSEAINEPSLNVRGLASAGVGQEARNVVPAQAVASLDLRLVKGMDWRAAQEKVITHIRAQGYHVVESEPDAETLTRYGKVARILRGGGYNAVRTSMDLAASRQVIRAAEAARGLVVKMPSLGGSVPLSIIEEVLPGVPLIGVPIANHDNSQHAANENLRLGNLWDGIELFAALFTVK